MLALLAALQPGAGDPRVGSWTLTAAQSSITPPDKLSITPMPGGVRVVMSGETHVDFSAKANGHNTPVPANPGFNQVELHRTNKREAQVKEIKDGNLFATVNEKVSNDGNELVSTTVSAGHPDRVTVWTRTGGARDSHDSLAGDWTEDFSKTRLRQGLVIKIEPNGGSGVRFSGDFSYVAHLDGKPYDVKNSRNDTVALQVVDPHTVDATYRRDDQVTQRDRWAVSADGQQMTATITATLETGQHLTEKLVFKKQ